METTQALWRGAQGAGNRTRGCTLEARKAGAPLRPGRHLQAVFMAFLVEHPAVSRARGPVLVVPGGHGHVPSEEQGSSNDVRTADITR